mgnify:CR=1 FL=1
MKAPIIETFLSIQGEGFNLGRPSIFVRFSGCNLKCRFKGKTCDTPYAMVAKKEHMVLSEDLVDTILSYDIKHVVFTGGEPLLYQDFIIEVMKELPENSFEFETNGTIPPRLYLKKRCCLFNVSPKLKSSNQPNPEFCERRINHASLSKFPKNTTTFKFVITGDNDLREVVELQKKYRHIPIYLMPEGVTRQEVIKHSPQVVQMCVDYGFTFSPREHIIIWNTKRGV